MSSSVFAATPYREPTEAEMRQAIAGRLNGAQAALGDLRSQCQHLGPDASPILAMQCLTVMAPPPPMAIKSFEKLNCGDATTGGYICDYVIAVDMGPLSVGLMAQPTTAHKRFVRTPSRGWIALDDN